MTRAPTPAAGGSYIRDEKTGALTRAPVPPTPVEPAVEPAVKPAVKEVTK